MTKSEVVRAEFSNEDFLLFNELHSRIIFNNQDLSARQSREECVKFSVKFTTAAVKSIINAGNSGLFIESDEKALMARIEAKIKEPLDAKLNEFEPLLRDLTKINNKVDADDENVTIGQKEWSELMLKVIALRGANL